MKFFIASPWKNREEVNYISEEIKKRGHEAHSFIESGSNLLTGQPIEDEMKMFSEALKNWREDERVSRIFESEIQTLRDSDVVILLLPAGISSHLEAGIAYGMGKKVILIGPFPKPEIVYLIFDRIFIDVSSFLKEVDAGHL